MATFNQFTGQYIQAPEDFARSFVDALPTIPLLRDGFQGYLNPSTYLQNQDFKNVVEGGSNFFFNPYERRAYRESTIPARLNLFTQRAQTNQNLNNAGLADSSYSRNVNSLQNILGQVNINRFTDDINRQVENARVAEETQRYLEEINRIQQALGLALTNFDLPESVTSLPEYNQPQISLF